MAREQIIGRNVHNIASKELAEMFHEKDLALFAAPEEKQVYECTVTTPDGTPHDVIFNKATFKKIDGSIGGLVGVILDISEQKKAARILTEQVRLLSLSGEISLIITEGKTLKAILQQSCQALVRFLDAAFARIWLFSPEKECLELHASAGMYTEIEGSRKYVAIDEKTKIGFIAQSKKAIITNTVVGDPQITDQEWAKREGMVAFAGHPLCLEDKLIGVLALFARHQFTDRSLKALKAVIDTITLAIDKKQKELEAENAHALLRSLIDSVPDLIFYKDKKSLYLGGNKAFSDFVKKAIPEIVGKSDFDLFPHDLARYFIDMDRQMLDQIEAQRNEEWVIAPGGKKILLDTLKTPYFAPDGQVIGLIGLSRDITEKKKAQDEKLELEAQLRQAQKLESIGTLAGGIAHDFNNILFAILGNAQIAFHLISQKQLPGKQLNEIVNAGMRARDLVKQILSFARMSKEERSLLNPTPIVKEVLKLLRSTLPSTIEIKTDLQDIDSTIQADPTELHQIMMNICTNAGHAMKNHGGMLTVGQYRVAVDEQMATDNLTENTGDYLLLKISDNGHGMPPELTERIFEPFFTTKAKGEGTGMGLSVVHGIVASMGGFINVSSQVGEGTTFEIYLPVAKEGKGTEGNEEEAEPIPRGRQEHILLVDDELSITACQETILTALNYRVTSFNNSVLALQAFNDNPELFDLVITDQTMPTLTGADLAKEMLVIRPNLPIIVCTGYSEMLSEEKAREIGIREYLSKPLMREEMAKAVHQALDECA